MPVESLTKCMEILDPYLEDLDWCLRDGFARYRTYPEDIIAEHDNRAATSCIYSNQLFRARQILQVKERINIIDLQGLWVVDFMGHVNLRFKKVDSSGKGRNAETKQQIKFDNQEDIPGLPAKAIRVIAGYQAEPSLTRIEKILVSRPHGKSVEWCVQIVLETGTRWVDITPEQIPGTERSKKQGKG